MRLDGRRRRFVPGKDVQSTAKITHHGIVRTAVGFGQDADPRRYIDIYHLVSLTVLYADPEISPVDEKLNMREVTTYTDVFAVSIENPGSDTPSLPVALLSALEPSAKWRSESGSVTAARFCRRGNSIELSGRTGK